MGWNIKQAADECGINPATWRAWESGRNRITDLSGAATKISARAGVDYVWLMVGSAVPEAVAGGREAAVGGDIYSRTGENAEVGRGRAFAETPGPSGNHFRLISLQAYRAHRDAGAAA